ncbi:DUF924 family protein [Acinetobacter soli]|uniref:DUF924 family protein n=1 Tax=Acinetobacter soli TaxID=487316 RepID=UPI0012507529|nr:DUF924 family protein [Acinetobacter soli]
MNYQDVLDFWFAPEHTDFWYAKDLAFDQLIRTRFEAIHRQACAVELWSWRHTPEGRLAEIIVLDQFSRNLYRDNASAFVQDPLALGLAQEAIALKLDAQLSPEQRSFLYMPFMHSESKAIHEFALKLFQRLGNETNLSFEKKHKQIIDRFGRYPHRNAILGRTSSAEELEFLTQPGSHF